MPYPGLLLLFLVRYVWRLKPRTNERSPPVSVRTPETFAPWAEQRAAAVALAGDDAAAQRRRSTAAEEDDDESEDEDVVQPATTIAGERAAGHGGSGVAATASDTVLQPRRQRPRSPADESPADY